ncbi:hypothetical protein D3C71_1745000 [compost metagenome]
MRYALIQRLLGAKVRLADVAARYDVDEKTVGAHSAKLKRWLFGSATMKGILQEANCALSVRLQTCALIPRPIERR